MKTEPQKYFDKLCEGGLIAESRARKFLRSIFDEIERRAESNMMKTHKLEGSHYAALKEVRKELGVERPKSKLTNPEQ